MEELKNLKVLFTEEEIQEKIREMAERLDKEYEGKDLTVVCILNGAVFFMVDLVKKMKTPIVLETLQAKSYEGTESTGEVKLLKDIDGNIEGRDVLLVEDIIDTGRTLKFVKEHLLKKNPKSLKIATLVTKTARTIEKVDIDYTCINLTNEFVVGYGFDLDGYGRNLPYIGCL